MDKTDTKPRSEGDAPEQKAPGVYAKLNKVMAQVGRIAKRGRNDYHGYDYVTEADIVDEVRPLMADAGLAFIPSQGGDRQEVTVQTKGGETTVVKILHTFRFVDTEDGSEVEVAVWGEGQDSMDKGSYKAFTGAEKYALLKTFMVATGDDPERDASRERAPSPSRSRPSEKRENGDGGHTCIDPDAELGFGKHKDKTWQEVADNESDYIDWLVGQEDQDRLCEDCLEALGVADESFAWADPLEDFPELLNALAELEGLNEKRAANARLWLEKHTDTMRSSPQALSEGQERVEQAIAEERGETDESGDEDEVQKEDRNWVEATLGDYYGDVDTWDAKLRMLGTAHPHLKAEWPAWDAMSWNTARRFIEEHEKEGVEHPHDYVPDAQGELV